jgi:hypothetical protein
VTATCGKGFIGKAKVTPCADNSQEYRLYLGSLETASENMETKHDRLTDYATLLNLLGFTSSWISHFDTFEILKSE